MAVINLGQMGEPRESALAGLSKYTGELAERRSREKTAGMEEQGRNTRAGLAASTELESKYIQAQAAKAEKTREFTKKALQNFSNKPKSEQELFLNTPEGKQFGSLVKKYLPEYTTEGRVVALPAEEKAYAPKTQEESIAFQKDVAEILQKIKSNAPLSGGDAIRLLQFVSMAEPMGQIDDQTAQFYKDRAKQVLKQQQGGNTYSEGLRDENDPLGILQ